MGNKNQIIGVAQDVLEHLQVPYPGHTYTATNYVKDVGVGNGEFRYPLGYLNREDLLALDQIIHGKWGFHWALSDEATGYELIVYERTLATTEAA